MPRRAWMVLLMIAVLATGSSAWATATIGTIANTVVTRTNLTHSANVLWISQGDCLAGDQFTFPLQISYDYTETLEVWVSEGVDCSQASSRGVSGVAPTCGLVYSSSAPSAPTTNIVLSDAVLITGVSVSGRTQPTPTCAKPPNASAGPQPLSIYFLFVSAAGNTVDAQQVVTFIDFDMEGPAAPANINALTGDTLLKVSWDQNTYSSVAGYYVFCDPPPGPVYSLPNIAAAQSCPTSGIGTSSAALDVDGGVTDDSGAGDDAARATSDASVADDAGSTDDVSVGAVSTDDSGTATADAATTCQCSAALSTGDPTNADFFNRYKCGQANGYTSTSINVTGLQNGIPYSLAVASFDVIGNVGALSTPFCNGAQPLPIQGFTEAYRDSGGTPTSSYCSVRATGSKPSGAGAAAGMLALAFALRLARRARRRQQFN